ncbi:STE20-related kinase adapter protein alpha isoform X1 [Cimex lectularius]|uniref:Protein kinase domain-containing protein n=2 Tax=Cimex lectularius TaxID=79782 RepID=A0A8I6R9H3_CIMLE|nr:STE20-related kinase adapter protein alpha isoform X1 [Cimex lectularius]
MILTKLKITSKLGSLKRLGTKEGSSKCDEAPDMPQSTKYGANSEDYKRISVLGRSTTGLATVHLAVHKPSDSWVALKQYNLDELDRENADLIKEEIILMRQLSHSCILSSFGSFVSGNNVVCILPVMGFGSTADLIARHFPTGLPEQIIVTVLKAVLQALQYLHSKGIIHRAVRGSHILISSDGYVKLGGFRYSCGLVSSERWNRKVHSFPPNSEPNLNWLSPELLEQNLEGYNEKSDIYSVGITACELANGIVPYFGTCKTLMLTEKVKGFHPQLIDASTFIPNGHGEEDDENYKEDNDEVSRVVKTRKFSDMFHSVTEYCLERDPNIRPSPKQILTLPFFKTALSPPSLVQTLKSYIDPADFPYQIQEEENADQVACELMNNLELDPIKWEF